MKKYVAIFLCLTMLLTLSSCAAQEDDSQTPQLLVGFGRADITPQENVPLGGYGNAASRLSDEVLDPLYATCVAFTDAEGGTVLIFQLDLPNCRTDSISFARKKIGDELGIPAGNVMVHATHTHSAPEVGHESPITDKYNDYLEEQMVAAALAAAADRKPAEMYTASTHVANMTFVRHYRMSDGTVAGSNFGDLSSSSILKHVKEADDEMQLVYFKRQGGKDVVMVNWQTHPLVTGGSTLGDVSSDVVGAMRMAFEPMLDCHMFYCAGASGDLNPTSQIGSERVTSDYLEMGQILARSAAMACDDLTKRETGKVQSLRKDQDVGSSFLCYAFSIGDVAFAMVGYEMFDSNGMYIKENSPFEMTMLATNGLGGGTYVAASWAYEYEQEAYELKGGYPKGTAEKLAEGYVDMLNELYNTRK